MIAPAFLSALLLALGAPVTPMSPEDWQATWSPHGLARAICVTDRWNRHTYCREDVVARAAALVDKPASRIPTRRRELAEAAFTLAHEAGWLAGARDYAEADRLGCLGLARIGAAVGWTPAAVAMVRAEARRAGRC